MRSGCFHVDALPSPSGPRSGADCPLLQPLPLQLPLCPAKADWRHRPLLWLRGFYGVGRWTLQPGQRTGPRPGGVCSGGGGHAPGAPLRLLGQF